MVRRITKKPDDIKNIVGRVIGKLEKQGPGKKDRVLSAWRNVAGEDAAEHSRPVSIRKKLLTIEIDSSTWLYALNLRKRGIVAKIKKELGEDNIRDIRFRMGDIT